MIITLISNKCIAAGVSANDTVLIIYVFIFQIRELQRGLGATKTAQKATQRILSKLLTDTYASSYNWIGSRGEKTAFSKSLMKHIIFGSFHEYVTTLVCKINFCNWSLFFRSDSWNPEIERRWRRRDFKRY